MNTEPKKDRTWQEDLQQLLPGPQVLAAGLCWRLLRVFYWTSLIYLKNNVDGRRLSARPARAAIFPVLVVVSARHDHPVRGRGSLWGLAFLAVWAAMQWAAVYFNFGSLPEYSMLPFLAGLVLFVGGWQALRWSWPSIVFLMFMIPLPGDVQAWFSLPLQGIATQMSVFIIQTLGIPAVAVGHLIQLTDRPLNVAEACSGLRMMMMFFAMCVGAAFLWQKPVWEKLLIVVSAMPIAVLGNVARIVVTAVGFEFARHFPSLVNPDQFGGSRSYVGGLPHRDARRIVAAVVRIDVAVEAVDLAVAGAAAVDGQRCWESGRRQSAPSSVRRERKS